MATLDTHAIARTLTDANHAQADAVNRRGPTGGEFDDALDELFETGRLIEAPSIEALEEWGVDVDFEVGGVLRGEAA